MRNKILFLAIAEVQGIIYFSAWNVNGLFKLFKDGRLECIRMFECGDERTPRHEFAIVFQNEIWFIPSKSDQKIAIYNPEKNELYYREIPTSDKACSTRPFWGGDIRDNKLYLFPNNYDAILSFDPLQNGFARIELDIDDGDYNTNDSVLISGIVFNESVYFLPWNTFWVREYNFSTGEFNKLFKIEKKCYRNIIQIDSSLVFIPREIGERKILFYNVPKRQLSEIDTPIELKGDCICAFSIDNYEFILAINDKGIWKYNLKSMELTSIQTNNLVREGERKMRFNEARKIGNAYVFSITGDSQKIFYMEESKLEEMQFDMKNETFLNRLLSMIDNKQLMTVDEW